tara:strand:+ start:342 stop:743 length:402 start_codon:yes stop_codon:yes gene_type:complete
MTIEIWLILALFVSTGINGVLIWFSREQSRQLSYVSQNLGDLVEIIANYREHLKKVYSLEMFYGDETLKQLMEHTNALVTILQQEYGDVTDLTDPLEVTFEKEGTNEEGINEEEAEEEEVQDVFYGGSRERNS